MHRDKARNDFQEILFNGPLFIFFLPFHMTQFKYEWIKAKMVCLGLKLGEAGCKAQTNLLSYGGTPFQEMFI